MISVPQAVKFSNERIRVLADEFAQIQTLLSLTLAEWSAKGISGLITNDATVIDDGADGDGRTPITGADIYAIIGLCNTFQTMAIGPDSAMPTILKVSVNPLGK